MPRPTTLPAAPGRSWLLLTVAFVALHAVAATHFIRPMAERVATEFAQCKHFFPAGLPPMVPKAPLLRELCFDGFAVLHSGQTKTPVFVAEHLDWSILQQSSKVRRRDHFYAEARLPAEERAEPADYHHSGFSLGHMAPQDAELNNGAWNDIEQDTRKYVQRAQADVYVFTGPVYSQDPPTIGAGQVQVPQYFYKLVYDPSTSRSWAHWQANEPAYRVSVPIRYEQLVRRTGIEFVPR